MNNSAYDTYLQTIVTAEEAAKNMGFEPYRFECPFCGEEVHIAAPFSLRKASHFRHLHGNAAVDCESYLGKGAAAISVKRRQSGYREVADIYFDYNNKTFVLRIKFTEEEILHYEGMNSSLEIRTSFKSEPFVKVKINHTNFAPGCPSVFPLKLYSDKYYISIDGSNTRVYELFPNHTSAFFRIQGDDEDYLAKRIKSTADKCVIYTNTRYLIVSCNYSDCQLFKKYLRDCITREIDIRTMRNQFWGLEVLINSKEKKVERFLLDNGYRIECNESFIVLWPPYYIQNESSYTSDDGIYVSSSFEIRQHSGNNINKDSIHLLGEITKLDICDGINICRKNTDFHIKKCIKTNIPKSIKVETRFCSKYIVPNNGVSILFDKSGTTCLVNGQKIYMSSDKYIKRYSNNVLIEVIRPKNRSTPLKSFIIEDANKYYKRRSISDDGKKNINAAIARMKCEGKL